MERTNLHEMHIYKYESNDNRKGYVLQCGDDISSLNFEDDFEQTLSSLISEMQINFSDYKGKYSSVINFDFPFPIITQRDFIYVFSPLSDEEQEKVKAKLLKTSIDSD